VTHTIISRCPRFTNTSVLFTLHPLSHYIPFRILYMLNSLIMHSLLYSFLRHGYAESSRSHFKAIFNPLSETPGRPRISDFNYTQPRATVPSYPRQCRVAKATFPLLPAGISFIFITTPLHNGSWYSTKSYSYSILPLNDDVGYRCRFIHSCISSRPAHVRSHIPLHRDHTLLLFAIRV